MITSITYSPTCVICKKGFYVTYGVWDNVLPPPPKKLPIWCKDCKIGKPAKPTFAA